MKKWDWNVKRHNFSFFLHNLLKKNG